MSEGMVSGVEPLIAALASPIAAIDLYLPKNRFHRAFALVLLHQQFRLAVGTAQLLLIRNQLRPISQDGERQFFDALLYELLQCSHIAPVHGGGLHFGAQQIHPGIRVGKTSLRKLDTVFYVL